MDSRNNVKTLDTENDYNEKAKLDNLTLISTKLMQSIIEKSLGEDIAKKYGNEYDNEIYAEYEFKTHNSDDFIIVFKFLKNNGVKKLTSFLETKLIVTNENISDLLACIMTENNKTIVKKLIEFNNKKANQIIYKLSEKNQDYIALLLKSDFTYVKNLFSGFKMDKDNAEAFFCQLINDKEEDLNHFCTNKDNFEALIKLLSHKDLYKIINIHTLQYYELIYSKIKTKSMKFRFSIYKNIQSNLKLVKEAKLLLKKLTDGTFDIIFRKYRSVIVNNPITAIDLIINEAINFNAMIPVYKKIVSSCHTLFIELFYFHTMFRLVKFTNIVDKYGYTKEYLNFINFIEVFFRVDIQPIDLFIRKNIKSKMYLHVPLLEKVIKYSKSKFSNPSFLKDSYIDAFLFGNQSIQLKIDIAECYYNICVQFNLDNEIDCKAITFENIEYLLPSQISKIKYDIEYEKIIDSFIESKNTNFYTTKNIIILINSNDRIFRKTLINLMDVLSQSKRNDIKVLSVCCKANLINREKKMVSNDLTDITSSNSLKYSTTESSKGRASGEISKSKEFAQPSKESSEINVILKSKMKSETNEKEDCKRNGDVKVTKIFTKQTVMSKYAKLNEHIKKNKK